MNELVLAVNIVLFIVILFLVNFNTPTEHEKQGRFRNALYATAAIGVFFNLGFLLKEFFFTDVY